MQTIIDISEEIKKIVEEALKKELEKELDIAVERFEKRKVEIISGILLNVNKVSEFKIMEDRIIFEIKNKSNQ